VRIAIHEFDERGLRSLTPGSSRPRELHAAFDEEGAEALRELLHRSRREFGKQSSLWTLEDALRTSASSKGSPASGSRARPSEPPSSGWGCAGIAPSGGSETPIRGTRANRGSREADTTCRKATPSGFWATRTRPAGAASSDQVCILGPRRESRCASSRRRRQRTTPTPKPSPPATDSSCRSLRRLG
jgi:hypothetical protein